MAFTYCTNCGEKIDDTVAVCPKCGHPKGAERSFYQGNEQNPYTQNTPQNPYGQNQTPYGQNQNPYGQNQTPYGQNQTPYGQNQNPYGQNQNPYGQNQTPYGQNQNPYGQNQNGQYRPPHQPAQRPISIGLTLFSILNILFGCCTLSGFILGIISLVHTVEARNAKDDIEEAKQKKIALALNVIAVFLTVLSAATFAIALSTSPDLRDWMNM